MVIIARAMEISGLSGKLADGTAEEVLRPYGDAHNVSSWAKEDVAETVQAGVVIGTSASRLAPQANSTRAEVAVIAQRLL